MKLHVSTPVFRPTEELAARLALLEASAGTGKTHSITTLFLRLIAEPEWMGLKPLKPENVLVVTFTEAATAEMRERIRTRLRNARDCFQKALNDTKWTPDDDEVLAFMVDKGRSKGELASYLRAVSYALATFDDITISTIHGFCQRMLLRNAFESGCDFDLELVPDLDPLIDDVVADSCVRLSYDMDKDLFALFESHVRGDLRRLAATVVSNPDLLILPSQTPDFDRTAWESWQKACQQLYESWMAHGQDAVDTLCSLTDIMNQQSYRPEIIRKKAHKLSVILGNTIDPYNTDDIDNILYFSCDRLKVKKGQSISKVPIFCNDVKKFWEIIEKSRLNIHAFFMEIRRSFIKDVLEVFAKRKRELHIQGFDDLLRRLRDGLRNGENRDALRRAIAREFRVAIIDEFQDTDPVQWEIFESVFVKSGPEDADCRLWVVGDPKQSIYRFRQADIEAYIEAKKTSSISLKKLDVNWRSDAALVQAINTLFSTARITDPFLCSDIPYEEVTPHHFAERCKFPESWTAPLRIAFLTGNGDEKLSKDAARDLAYRFIARDIRAFLEERPRILDEGGWREVHPGDIAVLVRRHHEGRAVELALRRLGIPCVRRSQDNVFETKEASELIRVLNAILNPTDRNAVSTGLATSILNVRSSELIESENSQALDWTEQLTKWAEQWSQDGFMKMFRNILVERKVVERALGREGGERHITNLLHLAELIHNACGREGPNKQLEWLHKQMESSDDADSRLLRLESDARAVKIVTIHACKGLQFPFVWCPFLWDSQLMKKDEFPMFHLDGRLVIDVAPEQKASYDDSLEKAKKELLAEAVRVAYVAITRAKHACTLCTGKIRGLAASALGVLLHKHRLPDKLIETALDDVSVTGLTDDLTNLVQHSAQNGQKATITWFHARVIQERSGRYIPPLVDQQRLVAGSLPPDFNVDDGWRWRSFTSMVKRGHEEAKVNDTRIERDYDDHSGLVASYDASNEQVPLDAFPSGRAVGELFHAIFEHLDFQNPDPKTIETQCARYGFTPDERLVAAVQTVLNTPLYKGGPRLAEIPMSDTLREMEFDMPVNNKISPKDLASIFKKYPRDPLPERYHESVAALEFQSFYGFLNGAIDLVFRYKDPKDHKSRWYIVDYKSNRLPYGRPGTFEDYREEMLVQEMARHHYFLQYHLYVVALHRYLKWRLPEYDYDSHFGGVFYLFIRGMNGSQTGIFRDRPPVERVNALSSLFDRAFLSDNHAI